jgi:hypothetical protein
METLPALAVTQLSIAEAYRIGRALRFIGYVLDQHQQRLKVGERVHRALREAAQARATRGESYTAEHLTADFLDTFGSRLGMDSAYLRGRILTYADEQVAVRRADENFTDLGPDAVAAARRAREGYSHPRFETLTKTLIPLVPNFHVSGPLYDDLERAQWSSIPKLVAKTGLSLCIVVDGEHWVPLSDEPETLARTEYLLIDARTHQWVICERGRVRKRGYEAVQIIGIEWNVQTGEKIALDADSRYELTGTSVSRWELSNVEQGRMLRVALGFLALLMHDQVVIRKISSPPQASDHFTVEFPAGLGVQRVVEDLNAGQHRRESRDGSP